MSISWAFLGKITELVCLTILVSMSLWGRNGWDFWQQHLEVTNKWQPWMKRTELGTTQGWHTVQLQTTNTCFTVSSAKHSQSTNIKLLEQSRYWSNEMMNGQQWFNIIMWINVSNHILSLIFSMNCPTCTWSFHLLPTRCNSGLTS